MSIAITDVAQAFRVLPFFPASSAVFPVRLVVVSITAPLTMFIAKKSHGINRINYRAAAVRAAPKYAEKLFQG